MKKIKIVHHDLMPKIDKIGKYKALNKKIICPVIEQNKKRIKDYEVYDIMHNADGITGKSNSSSKL